MRILGFVAFVFFASAPLAAQQATEPGRELGAPSATASRDRITLGLAGGFGPSYEGSDTTVFRPGGLIQGNVSGFDFAARGTNLFIDLLREEPRAKVDLVFGPVLQLRLERNSNIRDPQVSRLGKIKAAVEVGAYAGIGVSGLTNPFDKLSFDVTYRRDVSGIHDSYLVTPAVSFFTPVSRSTLVLLGLSADYVGRAYGQRYFGVTPAGSAASGLSPFTVDRAGWKSAGSTLLVVQSLERDPRKGFSVFALGGYNELLGRYRRSPVVSQAGKPGQLFGFAGLAYSF